MRLRLALLLFLASTTAAEEPLRDRWIYVSRNLWVDKNVDEVEALFRRAAAAGYNGVLLSDSKFSRLEDMDKRYFANVDRLKKVAAELKLEIVPAVFPIGAELTPLLPTTNPNCMSGRKLPRCLHRKSL